MNEREREQAARHEQACSNKRGVFGSRQKAKRRAKQILKQTGNRMNYYKCWWCGHYHLTKLTRDEIRERYK